MVRSIHRSNKIRVALPTTAKIDGSTVVVSAKEVKTPVAIRFAWMNESFGNFIQRRRPPLSSFRRDDWDVEIR